MVQDELLLQEEHTVIVGRPAAEPSEEKIIGSTFAQKYQILEFLGRGGMSTVYRARHLIMDKHFAIKILHSHLSDDSLSVRRFQQEAQAASALTDPGIVSVHDFGADEQGTPFLVMDLIEGMSLSQSIKSAGALSLERFLNIMQQVASALEHAHQRGVVHRDLKPSNIMVTTAGGREVAKIVDFGIAKIISRDSASSQQLTQTGELFGSPLYMSPEQCNGSALDNRSDIYALGCVMYESLTGKPPYLGETVFETINMQLTETPPNLVAPQLDEDAKNKLELLILKCLAKSASDRYQHASEIESYLRSLSMKNRTGVLAKIGGAWDLANAKRAARRKSKLPFLVTILTSVSCLSMVSMICLMLAFVDSDEKARKLADSRKIITEHSLIQLEFAKMNQLAQVYLMTLRTPEVLDKFRIAKEEIERRMKIIEKDLRTEPEELAAFKKRKPEIKELLNYSWTTLKGVSPDGAGMGDFQVGIKLSASQSKGSRIINELSAEAKSVDGKQAIVDKSREWVLRLALLCVLLNGAVLVSLLTYFARGTPKRLKDLALNAAKLSSKKHIEGEDEIAELDQVLQELATALSESEQREQALLNVIRTNKLKEDIEGSKTESMMVENKGH